MKNDDDIVHWSRIRKFIKYTAIWYILIFFVIWFFKDQAFEYSNPEKFWNWDFSTYFINYCRNMRLYCLLAEMKKTLIILIFFYYVASNLLGRVVIFW